jgi:tripartite-type tricarboxylate transporter receptor subunit TctC
VPEFPTLAEAGLRGFEVNNWTGVFAAAGTPPAVVSKLNTEVNRVMQLAEVQSRLPREGLRFVAMTPERFAGFVKSEKDKWAPLVKASGAKAD